VKKRSYWINQTLTLALDNILRGGGPFGAIVVKDDKIVGIGANRVTSNNDPTAHAEVEAIRDACQNLGTFQLKGCELYTSCEPCPMCFGAIYWARPDRVWYSATAEDAAKIGFDDEYIYDEIQGLEGDQSIPFIQIRVQAKIKPFKLWQQKQDKIEY
jgi:guanine deaminase